MTRACLQKFSARLAPVLSDEDSARVFRQTGPEWAVVALAVGIGIWFAVPVNISVPVLSAMCGLVAIMAYVFRHRPYVQPVMLAVLFLILGFSRTAWHTEAAGAPILSATERAYVVTGWIKHIDKSGSRHRWLIRVDEIEGLSPKRTPEYVRASVFERDYTVGQGVTVLARLSAPPGPVVPGGYDPGRAAYYKQIGGYGYAVRRAEPTDIKISSASERAERRLAMRRHALAQRIIAKSPPRTAGLQAALLTGIRSHIPEYQTDALRAAGLAHILAISGLHMGLLAGGVYSLASFLLACLLPLSRRYDMRKPAALVGILAATAYLLISGGSVATQRAYIMAVIVFLAVILDRRAFSMRSVAVAAFITLMWHPEALISAGFQMSFAAVAALIVVYRAWDERRDYVGPKGAVGRGIDGLASLSVTSLIAGLATGVYGALHFNRIAVYSLLGNLAAMPIFTFVVMPAAVGVFLLLPFGLEAFPLAVMGMGLDVVLRVATWVAELDGAIRYVAVAPWWLLGAYSMAFTALCIGPRRFKIGALGVMAVCLVAWIAKPVPDMRVSAKAQIAFRDAGESKLYVDSVRSDRYGREQFSEMSGRSREAVEPYDKGRAKCDGQGCVFDLRGRTVAVIETPAEVQDACLTADLVILKKRKAGPVMKRKCGVPLIDGAVLSRGGAQDVYISDAEIKIVPAITEARRQRPWFRQ